MNPIQSCAGGWCTKRDSCAHYHAASPLQTPSERLCPTGREDQTLTAYEAIVTMKTAATTAQQASQPVEMGRPRGKVIEAVEKLVRDAGTKGLTIIEARAALPEHGSLSVKSAIHNLVARYGFYSLLGGLKCGVFFAPEVPKDQAEASFESRLKAERDRQRKDLYAAQKRYNKRRAEKDAAERLMNQEAKAKARAERLAKQEREQQEKEAKKIAQAQERAKMSAARRAETAAANLIAKRIRGDGSRGPGSVKPEPVVTWGGVQVQKIPHQPGRYEVLTVEPVFTGKPLLPAQSCMGRALS